MMTKAGKVLTTTAVCCLAGCTPWVAPGIRPSHPAPAAASAYFDFSWELAGERSAAPLQVFDDGHRMWLQFSPAQGEPGLWRPAPDGGLLAVEYSRQGPYLVLQSVWPELRVQAAGGQASIRRQTALVSEKQMTTQDAAVLHKAADAPKLAPSLSGQAAGLSSEGRLPARQASASMPSAVAVETPPVVPGLSVLAAPESPTVFAVERADGHMRRTLARWAAQAGWTFQGEHWSVDVDIPIAGDAVFEMPFEQAVQALLGATELSDRPLQPCFYSNKVVRVVAFAQACDRTAAPGGRA